MKKRFRKQFDKLERRFCKDLERLHFALRCQFRAKFSNPYVGVGGSSGGGGGGGFGIPHDANYVIVTIGGSGGGGGALEITG